MTHPMLLIENLCIAAGDGDPPARVLHEIDVALAPGQVLGVIGESGAGKSTLGLAALGVIRPGSRVESGTVRFDGLDLLRLPPAQLRQLHGARIAYVAQSPALAFNPAQRLGDQVAEVLVLHRGISAAQGRLRAAELFDELDLPDPGRFGARFPHQVSGGQLQRAMIAMAMACEPELIVLDEPTSALDAATQQEVIAALGKTLTRHHAAALYITHDLAQIGSLADQILVLRHGRAVEYGAAEQVLERPGAEYTRQLLATTRLAGRTSAAAVEALVPAPVLLQLDDVATGYPRQPGVLRHVSLSLKRGEALALVGASGSGKSTLARLVCGLLPCAQGAMSFLGVPLADDFRKRSRDQSRRIQLVYQTPDTTLNPRQRIGRILGRAVSRCFGGSADAVRQRVAELLNQVGLAPEFADRLPHQLSGGQKQRVGIARALAARPDLIVCDEVTSALDPLVADDILDLLDTLRADSGVAYLFITHDLRAASRLADTVAVFAHGELVDTGTAATLLPAMMRGAPAPRATRHSLEHP